MTNLASIPLDANAPELVERLLRQAEAAGASDLHLQLMPHEAQLSWRLDGVLVPFLTLPREQAERVVGRIKYLSRLKTYQEKLPQDGRIPSDQAGTKSDVRVATYPTVTGEKVVLRFFTEVSVSRLPGLSLPEPAVAALRNFLQQPQGLMLLTGPAGSGKTSTIHACLVELAAPGGRHIITIEDPVERIIPGVMQTEVNEPIGLTFASAARHLLRQDPQVLVVGEIRDDETASIVIRAALTGHLVIATLHAGSCPGVVERLQLMHRDPSAVISSLQLIVNQRLVRRLCPPCRGEGCAECLKTGYRGRLPLVEWIQISREIRDAWRSTGRLEASPSPSLRESGRAMVTGGVTDQREFDRVVGSAETG